MSPRFAPGIAALLLAAAASAAEPPRIALVRPAHPDAVAGEAATRLQAELVAAGFTVILVDAEPGRDPEAEALAAAASSRSSATVALVGTGRGAAAEVWVTDPRARPRQVGHLDTGASAESSRPAALAIRTVELLRASLLEARAHDPGARPAEALPEDRAPPADAGPVVRRPQARRALLEGPSLELGLAAIYGLGETSGRLAPALRFGYGAGMGLAGRLTVLGTSTDQMALIDLSYGMDRSWHVIAPVVSVGAGGCHTHLDDTATPRFPRLRTEAWSGVLSAGAGVAARLTDRAAFVIDASALLVEPGPGAVVGTVRAGGKPMPMATASLGILAGF
jgi:hypothetical protein